MKEIPLAEGDAGITGNAVGDPPTIAFDRIVAACLDLEWQIKPRAAQRGVKVAGQGRDSCSTPSAIKELSDNSN